MPPVFAATKDSTRTPNTSSRCFTPAIAPLRAKTKVPARSSIYGSDSMETFPQTALLASISFHNAHRYSRDELIHMPTPIIPRVTWRDAGTTATSGLKNIQCLMPVDTSGSHDEIHLFGG